jgi:aldehyde dehydrogenase (NAD+)
VATAVSATESALADLRFHSGKVFIDGAVRDPRSQQTIDQVFPGNGRVVAKVARCNVDDVEDAVASARRAFEDSEWSGLNVRDRRRLMLRYAQVIEDNRDQLAKLNTLDSGVPIAMSSSFNIGPDVVADMFQYYAGLVDKEIGEVLPVYPGQGFDYTLREPLGVVTCITAWNAPIYLYGAKVAPALACGNTVIVKPSELGATATLRLAELAIEAGIPKGVINVITGFGPECGEPLVRHAGVDGISFTGGVATGRRIQEMASATLKRVVLELGGKSANIIFDDAEPALAAMFNAGMVSYGMSGQGCVCATRALVQEGMLDSFNEQVASTMQWMKPGDPFDPATIGGPIISERQLNRVLGYVAKGREEGATVVCGGQRMGGPLADGYYMEPTLLSNVRNDMTPAREEIFGPVLVAIPFKDEEEAIRIANDTEYGLGGVVMTRDLKRAHRVAAKIRAGTVGVNTYAVSPSMPFGGIKQSGYGREGSRHAMNDYSYVKNVYVDMSH